MAKKIIIILESEFASKTLNGRRKKKKIKQTPISVFVFICNNSVCAKPGFLTCECQTKGLNVEQEAL